MSLLIFDPAGNWIQTIPAAVGGVGGYDDFIATDDIFGGYAGGSFSLPLQPTSVAAQVELGYNAVWWPFGYPLYGGKVIAKDNTATGWKFTLNGTSRQVLSEEPADAVLTGYTASDVMWHIITLWGTDPNISASTDGIYPAASWAVSGAIDISKMSQKNMFEKYNAFELWEWGNYFAHPGGSLNEKVAIYHRQPDMVAQHYTVDVRDLATRPKMAPDMNGFVNQLRVYYSTTAGTYKDYAGTAASKAKYGQWSGKIDIGGVITSVSDADRVAAVRLDALKVEGIETPPLATSLVLDAGTKLIGNGQMQSRYDIRPGQNILVVGGADMPRTLAATDARTFLHCAKVTYYQSGQVKVDANRFYDPAGLIAMYKTLPNQ